MILNLVKQTNTRFSCEMILLKYVFANFPDTLVLLIRADSKLRFIPNIYFIPIFIYLNEIITWSPFGDKSISKHLYTNHYIN